MPVITIAREFGAGGSRVAAILSDRLGAEIVDRSLIAEVALRAQLAPEQVAAEDERPRGLVDRILLALAPFGSDLSAGWEPPYPDPFFDPRRAVLELTERVIRQAAATGNAIVVGRGSAFVLVDHPGALHVFLHAPASTRIRTVMERFGIPEDVARRRLHETDANRAAYMRQVYGSEWRSPAHYDLVLNTDRLGYERSAAAILAALP